MSMERITVEGDVLRGVDRYRKGTDDRAILDTDIGFFLIEDGCVSGKTTPSHLNYLDQGKIEKTGTMEVEFILPDGFELHYSEELDENGTLSVGDNLLIDMRDAEEIVGFSSEVDEIVVNISDRHRVNVLGSAEETFNMLGKESNFTLTPSDKKDYESRQFVYTLERNDENSMKKVGLISDEVIRSLIKRDCIKRLHKAD